ncbi:unnamed protein product, partial [Didymodactylos carnosus]
VNRTRTILKVLKTMNSTTEIDKEGGLNEPFSYQRRGAKTLEKVNIDIEMKECLACLTRKLSEVSKHSKHT